MARQKKGPVTMLGLVAGFSIVYPGGSGNTVLLPIVYLVPMQHHLLTFVVTTCHGRA